MLDEIISYHRIMVELLLFVIVLNLLSPLFFKQQTEKMVFWTRVGYFGFWMFWSMNIFAGLIVFMFTGRELTLSVILMIAVSLLLAMIEGYRAIQSKKRWLRGVDAYRFSAMILTAEIVLVATVSLYAIQAQ